MALKDFTIGEKVCIKCYCRYPEPHYEDRDGVIEAIGRKYITVSINGFSRKFEVDCRYPNKYNCVETGHSAYTMFKTEQDYCDYKEHEELRKWFYKLTTDSKVLSLDQLRRIKAIVEEGVI